MNRSLNRRSKVEVKATLTMETWKDWRTRRHPKREDQDVRRLGRPG
ncbi:hypothetical protein PC128_g3269 [Phytophthora cactorum]|nr:hypothetical protein PC120_g10984 [Phytophthora cactorum]KAG3202358.1 hypothetical protein PC128_g3269 [Phytophthora cactorum]KAG4039573.1 hypothetical protein PC123_g24884 [Phytophthora cactorum]